MSNDRNATNSLQQSVLSADPDYAIRALVYEVDIASLAEEWLDRQKTKGMHKNVNDNEQNETVSPGGIILPSMPQEPEPPQPEEPKKKPWTFTIGWELVARHDPEFARQALEDLYKVCDASGVGKRSPEEQAKYERTLDLLNQLSFEIMGEIPQYEQLC